MKDQLKIEEYLKQRLEGFEETPPTQVWDKVAAGLTAATPTQTATASTIFSSRNILYTLSAAAIVVAVIFGINYFQHDDSQESVANVEKTEKPAAIASQEKEKNNITPSEDNLNTPQPNTEIEIVTDQNIDESEKSIQENNPEITQKVEIKSIEPSPDIIESKFETPKTQLIVKELNVNDLVTINKITVPIETINLEKITLSVPEKIAQRNQDEEGNTEIVEEIKPEQVDIKSKQEPVIVKENINTSEEETISETAEEKSEKAEEFEHPEQEQVPPPPPPIDRRTSKLSFGLVGGIDRIFNTEDSKTDKKFNYAGDLRVNYHFSDKFFIESGLGIDYSEDNWQYEVYYLRNELIGTYDGVDSVEVTFDNQGNPVPIYHTSQHHVYDSVNHEMKEEITNHYTYLHLPVYFGYIIHEHKRFSVSLKGGAMFSVLINEKESTPELASDIEILEVQNQQKSRINTNTHLAMSLGLHYKLNKTFSLTAEPIYKYFSKSIYDNSSIQGRKPESFGFRAGVLVKF